MKVVVFETIVTPYDISRFNLINDIIGNNFWVFFSNMSDINRNWIINMGSVKFRYKILPDLPIRIKGKDIFTFHINYTAFSELRKVCPDVVISCGWDSFTAYMSFIYCRMYRKKYILWAGSTINEPSWRRTVSLPLVKFLIRNSDSFIAYGTRAKEYLIHLGAKQDKIFIGWNTVDNSFFEANSKITAKEKDALKKKLGIKKRLVLLYVGQLIRRKGVYDLLEAYSLLKKETDDVALLIVGSGMEEKDLRRKCDQEGIKDVVFAGFLEYSQLPEYFGISDLFILPSYEEVWGLVINEAMACGLPVITTEKVGASADLVKDSINGFIVLEKDPQGLYRAIKKVVSDDDLRQKMAASSGRIIRDFGIEQTVGGIKEAISFAAGA